jgi:hypothetical protein
MKSLGVLLVVLGAGSFILPMVGLQFRLMSIFGDAQPVVAVVAVLVGVVLLVISTMRGKATQGPQSS